MPDRMQESMSEEMPDRMPGYRMPKRISEQMPMMPGRMSYIQYVPYTFVLHVRNYVRIVCQAGTRSKKAICFPHKARSGSEVWRDHNLTEQRLGWMVGKEICWYLVGELDCWHFLAFNQAPTRKFM